MVRYPSSGLILPTAAGRGRGCGSPPPSPARTRRRSTARGTPASGTADPRRPGAAGPAWCRSDGNPGAPPRSASSSQRAASGARTSLRPSRSRRSWRCRLMAWRSGIGPSVAWSATWNCPRTERPVNGRWPKPEHPGAEAGMPWASGAPGARGNPRARAARPAVPGVRRGCLEESAFRQVQAFQQEESPAIARVSLVARVRERKSGWTEADLKTAYGSGPGVVGKSPPSSAVAMISPTRSAAACTSRSPTWA